MLMLLMCCDVDVVDAGAPWPRLQRWVNNTVHAEFIKGRGLISRSRGEGSGDGTRIFKQGKNVILVDSALLPWGVDLRSLAFKLIENVQQHGSSRLACPMGD
jgi:hypothetical protein